MKTAREMKAIATGVQMNATAGASKILHACEEYATHGAMFGLIEVPMKLPYQAVQDVLVKLGYKVTVPEPGKVMVEWDFVGEPVRNAGVLSKPWRNCIDEPPQLDQLHCCMVKDGSSAAGWIPARFKAGKWYELNNGAEMIVGKHLYWRALA